MKKIIKLIFIFVLTIALCSCNKKEYKLIELTSTELVNHLLKGDTDLVFITYDENNEQNEEFFKNVQKIAKIAKENIYYIDINHMVFSDEILLTESGIDYKNLLYIVVQDGATIINEQYTDYDTMFKALNGKNYEEQPKLISDEEKNEHISLAREYYNKGQLVNAYNELAQAWTLQEAKDEFKNNKYYYLLNEWESFQVLNNQEEVKYDGFLFYTFNSTMYTATKTDKIEGFTEPDLDKYTSKYYYIKNDCIYTSKDQDGSYKKEYKIKEIEKNKLVLEKNNQIIELSKMKD